MLPLAAPNGPYWSRMYAKEMEMTKMTVTGLAGYSGKCDPMHGDTSWEYPQSVPKAS